MDRPAHNRLDLSGQRFGRLTAVAVDETRTASGRVYWRCRCDCGAEVAIATRDLRSGHSKSCGCYAKDVRGMHSLTHGKTGTVEHRLYVKALERARRRGLDFDLTLDDIVVPDVCPVLGIPLTPGSGKKHDSSPSLDRIDPRRGYVRGNVAVISLLANRIKQDSTSSEEIERVAAWLRDRGL